MRKFLPAMVIFQLEEGEKWGINETTIKWSSFDFRVTKIFLCTLFLIHNSARLRTSLYRGLSQLWKDFMNEICNWEMS
jgi:hypothetical protein